jgi:uncharacterized protein
VAGERIGEVDIGGTTRGIDINFESGRFELNVDGLLAFMTFRLRGSVLSLIHTEVPRALRGQGIAGTLAHGVLEYARTRALSVNVICPFVAKYLTRHPEFQDLVARD